MLFRIDYYRLAFYQLDGVTTLVKYLDGTLNSTSSKDQMQYQVTFCLWLLTFNEQIANKIQNKSAVVFDYFTRYKRPFIYIILYFIVIWSFQFYLIFSTLPRKKRSRGLFWPPSRYYYYYYYIHNF